MMYPSTQPLRFEIEVLDCFQKNGKFHSIRVFLVGALSTQTILAYLDLQSQIWEVSHVLSTWFKMVL